MLIIGGFCYGNYTPISEREQDITILTLDLLDIGNNSSFFVLVE